MICLPQKMIVNLCRFAMIIVGMVYFKDSSAQTKTWYFGEGTGVDFTQSPPAGIDGPIFTNEGCATVTNPRGKVIFSTDGENVYDAQGVKVFSGLKGDISSTHSAIIIPHPANPCERFFVFTVGSAENQSLNRGLQVCEIVSSGANLQISASTKLHENTTEKLAATPDGAGGYWLISHDYIDTADALSARGRRFFAYHVTSNSSLTNLTPVISIAGTMHEGASPFGGNYWNTIGQMKFNKEGDKLALALYARAVVDIFHFEKSSGRFHFLTKIDQFQQSYPGTNVYGLEFSPNGRVLYVSTGYVNPTSYGYVWGFSMDGINSNTMWNNRQEVVRVLSIDQNKYPFGALQLGPDNAIYIARNKEPFLDKIMDPDNHSDPHYIAEAISLTDTCRLGLPTTIKSVDCSNSAWPCSYFDVDISVDTSLCEEDSLKLGFDPQPGFLYRWNTGARTSFIYGKAGQEYRVGVTDTAGCYATSFFTIPKAEDLMDLKVPEDTSFCREVRNSLSFAYPGVKYKWQDGSTYEYSIDQSEDVGVEFYSSCDTLMRIIHAELEDCSCDIHIPNAFTPNRDYVNDQFILKAPCPLEYYRLEIFNRWGEKVFESNDVNDSWDGTIGSKPAKPDTYLYLLEYESPHSDPVYEKGALTLLK